MKANVARSHRTIAPHDYTARSHRTIKRANPRP